MVLQNTLLLCEGDGEIHYDSEGAILQEELEKQGKISSQSSRVWNTEDVRAVEFNGNEGGRKDPYQPYGKG